MMRAYVSVLPPGGKGTTKRIGRLGYASACTEVIVTSTPHIAMRSIKPCVQKTDALSRVLSIAHSSFVATLLRLDSGQHRHFAPALGLGFVELCEGSDAAAH